MFTLASLAKGFVLISNWNGKLGKRKRKWKCFFCFSLPVSSVRISFCFEYFFRHADIRFITTSTLKLNKRIGKVLKKVFFRRTLNIYARFYHSNIFKYTQRRMNMKKTPFQSLKQYDCFNTVIVWDSFCLFRNFISTENKNHLMSDYVKSS